MSEVFWGEGFERTRRGHPVQRFIAAAIGVDEDTAIAFEHDHSGGKREMSAQPAGVIHRAGCNNEAHRETV